MLGGGLDAGTGTRLVGWRPRAEVPSYPFAPPLHWPHFNVPAIFGFPPRSYAERTSEKPLKANFAEHPFEALG